MQRCNCDNNKEPHYGYPFGKNTHCIRCKLVGMVRFPNKNCCIDGCTKKPFYKFHNDLRKFCSIHRLTGMHNFRNHGCHDYLCTMIAKFNYRNFKYPIFCSKHALIGMIDLKHTKCLKCDKRPSFNYTGLRPIYCKKHCLSDMINVIHVSIKN